MIFIKYYILNQALKRKVIKIKKAVKMEVKKKQIKRNGNVKIITIKK